MDGGTRFREIAKRQNSLRDVKNGKIVDSHNRQRLERTRYKKEKNYLYFIFGSDKLLTFQDGVHFYLKSKRSLFYLFLYLFYALVWVCVFVRLSIFSSVCQLLTDVFTPAANHRLEMETRRLLNRPLSDLENENCLSNTHNKVDRRPCSPLPQNVGSSSCTTRTKAHAWNSFQGKLQWLKRERKRDEKEKTLLALSYQPQLSLVNVDTYMFAWAEKGLW